MRSITQSVWDLRRNTRDEKKLGPWGRGSIRVCKGGGRVGVCGDDAHVDHECDDRLASCVRNSQRQNSVRGTATYRKSHRALQSEQVVSAAPTKKSAYPDCTHRDAAMNRTPDEHANASSRQGGQSEEHERGDVICDVRASEVEDDVVPARGAHERRVDRV